MKKTAVIGLGYVGLGIAINAASKSKVIGFDLDKTKVDSLNTGKSYIEDISNNEVKNAINSGQFIATNQPNLLADAETIVICVPTPLDANRLPDLSMVIGAAKIIAENVKTPALIINESTSYPGTLRNIIKETIELTSNINHEYASSPERVDPGNSTWNLRNTPRLVSGLTPNATRRALDFYTTFASNLVEVSSPEVAETAKLFENTFRQVNIALANELAMICNSLNINVFDVINAANTKPYGFMKFNPGPGVGGHCIPVDPTYLAYIAEEAGVKARFIDLANQVNLDMPSYIIDRCERLVGNLGSKKILIAGVSY
jgi:UDP-N-acetyl-D-glucosamine dehydrogenase